MNGHGDLSNRGVQHYLTFPFDQKTASMKVLIVEDEKISQVKMKTIMSEYGICNVTANGLIAYDMFLKGWEHQAPFDIIMLDIGLHEMNGIDLLLQIREKEETLKIPRPMQAKVIMVTSCSDKDHVNVCLTGGANGYIVKPFSDESVCKVLRSIYIKHIQEFFTPN